MTDKERQTLCDALRKLLNPPVNCLKAANELERLAAENDWLRNALRAAQIGLAQPDADRSGPADYVPPGGAGNGA